jgi:hypothetical protein
MPPRYDHPPKSTPHRLLLGLAVAAALAPPSVQAWHLSWFAELGIEHNSNVQLSETDPVSETILRPSVGFALSQQGATIQAHVGGLFEHRSYLDDTYGSEFLAELDGSLNWVIAPGRLHFTVQDRLAVLPITLAAPDSPDNRQQTNVFAAGPTLFFRFSPTMRGQAELRWIDSYAEETAGFDSTRWSGALRLIKDLGPTRRLSFNLQGQTVDLDDNTTSPDYERYDAFVRYTQTLSRLSFEADAGYSWYDPEVGPTHSGPLVRAMLGYSVSERSRLTVTAARRYSDTAEALIGEIGGDGTVPSLPPIVIVGSETVDSATYRETSLELGYAYDGVRHDFTVTPFYRELDYVDELGPDQTGRGIAFGWTWLLRENLSLNTDVRFERLRFDLTGVQTRTRVGSIWLRRQFTPHWSGRLGFSRYERDSDETGLSAEQNVAYLAITYVR